MGLYELKGLRMVR